MRKVKKLVSKKNQKNSTPLLFLTFTYVLIMGVVTYLLVSGILEIINIEPKHQMCILTVSLVTSVAYFSSYKALSSLLNHNLFQLFFWIMLILANFEFYFTGALNKKKLLKVSFLATFFFYTLIMCFFFAIENFWIKFFLTTQVNVFFAGLLELSLQQENVEKKNLEKGALVTFSDCMSNLNFFFRDLGCTKVECRLGPFFANQRFKALSLLFFQNNL